MCVCVRERDLDEEDGVAAAGALVEFGGGGGAVETGWDELRVELREGGERRGGEAGDEDVVVLILPDGQVLGARTQQVQHLRKHNTRTTHTP